MIGIKLEPLKKRKRYKKRGFARVDQKTRYRRRKRWIDVIKVSLGCAHCGYRASPVALDFDHIDPATKEFLIPRYLGNGNLARIFREIRKCRILCANCHRIHSNTQWNEGITYKTK